MIGMPIASGNLPWLTAASLIGTVRVCDKEGVPVRIETPVGCSVVQWARSAVAASFLKGDCTHLFWIDSDIVWTPDDFFRILGLGATLDVVGATYPLKTTPGGFVINTAGKPGGYEVNGLGCVKVDSIGLGFTLVKRAVMEAVAATKPRVRDPLNGTEDVEIFRVDRTAAGRRGEDVAFFADVRKAGFDVWLDPSVALGHVGSMVYRGDVIEALGLQEFVKETK
jgi:hypothetical protein